MTFYDLGSADDFPFFFGQANRQLVEERQDSADLCQSAF